MGHDPQKPRRPLVSDEERDLFLDAVSGTKPIDERERVRIPPPAPAKRVLPPEPLVPMPIPLTVEGDGEAISARAPGVNRMQVHELRGGRVRPEATLDLHGETAVQASASLKRFLLDASTSRRRCVLIVHGRGLHSDGLAVLRDVVITELVGSLSGLVHAFATATPRDGGSGATYIMVRS
jgi:DNA-nicking Smr family endonuclease